MIGVVDRGASEEFLNVEKPAVKIGHEDFAMGDKGGTLATGPLCLEKYYWGSDPC